MAIVKNNFFEDGDVPTAAELNQPYDDAATATATLGPENVADNWITIKHINAQPAGVFNKLFKFIYSGTSQFSTNSTSYVTVDSTGANPSEVILGYQPEQQEIYRVECSGLVTNINAEQTYDSTAGPPNGDRNYYAFRLLLTYDDGAGPLTLSLGEWGYSFTTMAGGTSRYWTSSNGQPKDTGVPLGFQTFQFSKVFKHNGATGSRTFTKIELQSKVNYNGNTLKVSRNNIVVVRATR